VGIIGEAISETASFGTFDGGLEFNIAYMTQKSILVGNV
jgi:hypothetical protein